MKTRQKNVYPLDAKTKFGVSTMGWMRTIAQSFMTSLFMLYLTDYSNIGAYAATLGTVLLLVARILDAVDDPIQGMLMDRSKPGKHGKYKKFLFLGTIMTAVAIICLFAMPKMSNVLVTIWVLVFYMLYDIGSSFIVEKPVIQSLTADENKRSKLFTFSRIFGALIAIPMAFFISMVEGVGGAIGNKSLAFSILAAAVVLPIAAITIGGIVCVKEGAHKEKEEDVKIKFKDIIYMFRTNKALLVKVLSNLFSGFVWTMIFATSTYFLKWNYCADTNGVIDTEKFGLLTTVMGALQLIPTLISAFTAGWFIKKLGSAVKVQNLSLLGCTISSTVMFLMYVIGALPVWLFFIILFITLFFSGLTFVPGSIIDTECMDYGLYKTGKEMHGVCNAVFNFLEKAQTALSSVMVGGILIAIGYEVNSTTGDFVGDVAQIPHMLIWFVIVMALVPAILSLLAWIIMKFYPINNKVREEMKAVLHQVSGETDENNVGEAVETNEGELTDNTDENVPTEKGEGHTDDNNSDDDSN